MATRLRTTVTLPPSLMNDLKMVAKQNKKSVSSIIEESLLDMLYHEPNETTKNAIEEAKKGVGLKTVDASNIESFIKSMEE